MENGDLAESFRIKTSEDSWFNVSLGLYFAKVPLNRTRIMRHVDVEYVLTDRKS